MKRQTLQKTIILEALKTLGNHPTPAMVYEEIHEKYPTISQATVFRVLASECEEGHIQRVYAPGSSARYEYGTRKHCHICCRLCGKVADIDMPYPEDLISSVTDSEGFNVEKYYIEFVGLCRECNMSSDLAGEDKKEKNL